MKKLSVLLIFILAFTIALSGCTSKTTSKDTVAISYVKLPLNVPSIIEKNNELFETAFGEKEVEVTFPEITQGSKMTEALAAGSLDFCNALGGTSAILAAANGVDIKIIGTYSRAPKAFTIMAKDDSINSISDLKGKKIVGPKGTILHQLLLSALVSENMTVDDVEFINMGISDGLSAMSSDSADVALVAGPAVTTAIENGNHIITTGEGFLDATIVIATSGDMIENHLDLVKTYLDVHNKSLQFMETNPDETYEMAANETGISVDAVKEMLPWYDFNPEITDNDINELIKTQDFLIENGMLENAIDINEMITIISN